MKPLLCPYCLGSGIVERDYDTERVYHETCDECDGAGTQVCVETGCIEPPTHIFWERGQLYPLCQAHFVRWMADANA